MPGATTRTNTRATVLSDEELRLMASVPGIELSVVEILKTLAALVLDSADRETRLNKRIDEMSRQLKDVNEELGAGHTEGIFEKNPWLPWTFAAGREI